MVLWLLSSVVSGCHNPETWNPEFGNEFTKETTAEIIEMTDNEYTAGITLTGGDPFFPANNSDMFYFLREFKEELPEKTVWAWTGFTYEYIRETKEMNRILEYIDVLVDGEFDAEQHEEDLKEPNHREVLKYRGSSNQRVIDVNKSMVEGKIILYGKDN